MGLFGFGGTKESAEEIDARIRNSEAAHTFAMGFSKMLNEGDEHYQWLLANSKERMLKMEVFKNGIGITYVEVNRIRLKETGTYDVDKEAYTFGAAGYQDLPNSKYVYAFRRFLIDEITKNCPNVTFSDDYIKLKETAKKGW